MSGSALAAAISPQAFPGALVTALEWGGKHTLHTNGTVSKSWWGVARRVCTTCFGCAGEPRFLYLAEPWEIKAVKDYLYDSCGSTKVPGFGRDSQVSSPGQFKRKLRTPRSHVSWVGWEAAEH